MASKIVGASGNPSNEEAAAMIAALELMLRESVAPVSTPMRTPDRWRETALLEGISRGDGEYLPEPWINA